MLNFYINTPALQLSNVYHGQNVINNCKYKHCIRKQNTLCSVIFVLGIVFKQQDVSILILKVC